MLILIPLVLALFVIPVASVATILRDDVDDSVKALAILILSPFIVFALNVIRLNQ